MKISIIIASYNYADLIGRAIESIISQTYDNCELIIVDDGSVDNSIEIINKYVEKYENIHLYQHPSSENKGLKETVKLGLEKATSNYIAFLECDDYWENNYLEEKVKILEKYPNIKFIFNDVNLVGDEKSIRKLDSHFKMSKRFLSMKPWPRKLFQYFFMLNLVPTFSSVLIEKSVIKSCDFETPIDALLDLWLWIQISANNKFYYIDKKLTNWMIHPASYLNTSPDVANKKKQKLFFDCAIKLIMVKKRGNILMFFKLMLLKSFMIPRIDKLFRGLIKKLLVIMES
ncbi:MAG: glycosyltransferase [uncultured bacterium]|nr:MAG: glycosyltransferase [uncultured bacterium]